MKSNNLISRLKTINPKRDVQYNPQLMLQKNHPAHKKYFKSLMYHIPGCKPKHFYQPWESYEQWMKRTGGRSSSLPVSCGKTITVTTIPETLDADPPKKIMDEPPMYMELEPGERFKMYR